MQTTCYFGTSKRERPLPTPALLFGKRRKSGADAGRCGRGVDEFESPEAGLAGCEENEGGSEWRLYAWSSSELADANDHLEKDGGPGRLLLGLSLLCSEAVGVEVSVMTVRAAERSSSTRSLAVAVSRSGGG